MEVLFFIHWKDKASCYHQALYLNFLSIKHPLAHQKQSINNKNKV